MMVTNADIKRLVRAEIKDSYALTLREEIKNESLDYSRKEFFRFFESVGKEIIIEELKNVDVPAVLTDRFDSLLQNKMTPIIENAVVLASKKVSGKISLELKRIIDLKTSTICEIKTVVESIPVESERDSLALLKSDFPEYYEQITVSNGMLIERDS